MNKKDCHFVILRVRVIMQINQHMKYNFLDYFQKWKKCLCAILRVTVIMQIDQLSTKPFKSKRAAFDKNLSKVVKMSAYDYFYSTVHLAYQNPWTPEWVEPPLKCFKKYGVWTSMGKILNRTLQSCPLRFTTAWWLISVMNSGLKPHWAWKPVEMTTK